MTAKDSARYCQMEMRRDRELSAYIDRCIQNLMGQGLVPVGTPLEAILESSPGEGPPLARVWLNAFHSRTNQPQWLRARQAVSAG